MKRRRCFTSVSFGLVFAAGLSSAVLAVAATPPPTTTELKNSPDDSAASASAAAATQGTKASVTVTLEVSPTPVALGEEVRLAATVTSSVAGDISGTITFSNGPNTLGVAPVGDGRALLTTTALPVGSNMSLTAYYSGNAEFNPSVSIPVHLTTLGRLRPNSAIDLTVSPAQQVTQGTVVTLSAQVSDAGHPIPVGVVNFYSTTSAHPGQTLLGQAQLTSAGVATMKFRPPLGSLEFQAIYQGTNTHASSASASQSMTVTGRLHTSTAIVASPPFYSAAVTTYGPLPAGGEASFIDASESGLVLASAPLSPSSTQFSLGEKAAPNLGGGQYAVKLADFNGDGILDAAVVPGVVIFLGNPDGSFTEGFNANVNGLIRDIAIADFNGDGIPDIAVLLDGSSVVILLGRGDGTFVAQPAVSVGSGGASTLVSADFNGDGNADLLTTNFDDGSTTVLLGDGAGGFRTIPSPNLGGQAGNAAVVADFNGDGIPDVVTMDYDSFEFQTSVNLLLGNGDGTFLASSFAVECDPNSAITAADFNGDGFPDILVSSCGSAMDLFLGNGNGTFTFTSVPGPDFGPIEEPAYAETGDLNNDGHLDLVLTASGTAQIGVLLGNGDGTFEPGPVVSVPLGALVGELALGDFTGDGIPDILSTGQSNAFTGNQDVTSLSEWISTITQTSQATTTATLPGTGAQQIYALYPGDAEHVGSVSATVSVSAAPAAAPAH